MKKRPILALVLIILVTLVTAQLALGQVIINEIMYNPNEVSDTNGEYVELYNDDLNQEFNIEGWTLRDDGNNAHTIDNGAPLIVQAGGFLVLCNNADSQTNGEFNCDYEYSSFTLSNGEDEVVIEDENNQEIDRVEYSVVAPWPAENNENNNLEEGASIELIDPVLDNNDGTNWRGAQVTFGNGDLGTPGTANNGAPEFTSIPLTDVEEDSVYVYTVLATDINNDQLTLTASIIPDWLTFTDNGDSSAVLTGTPTNDDVGTHDVTITVSDNYAPIVQQSFTITVANTNDAPVANDDTATTNEETEVSIDVLANDQDDDNDELTIESVTQPTHGTAVINTEEQVDYTPEENYFGEDTFTYTISDGNGETATATVTLTITEVNDAPVITSTIADQQATEDIAFSLQLTATDVYNEQEDLFINEQTSDLPSWLTADDNNPLLLTGTPDEDDIVTDLEVSVVVNDGTDDSEPITFNITVIPGLQLLETITVSVNGQTQDIDNLSVAPGDEVHVTFQFRNNIDHTLGHVENEVTVDEPDFAELPHQGICEGVNCNDGHWALLSGETATDEFTFTVPFTISSNDFTLNFLVNYDNFLGLFRQYQDVQELTFNVMRQEAGAVFEDISISDSNLTCTRTIDLDLEVANTGKNTLQPEILIYDKEPVLNSFSHITGEFTSFIEGEPSVFIEQTLAPINSGESPSTIINVDTINLSEGQQTLYVFIVNPYFDEDAYFIGDSREIELMIGTCLNTSALEEHFTIPKNHEQSTSADLLEFINEDTEGYTFTFSITEEEEEETGLINCDVTDPSIFNCGAPTPGRHGISEVTISIDETNALTPLEESFTVTVAPTLEISDVQLNNVAIEQDGDSTPLKPQQAVTLQFTLRNNLNHPVTGIDLLIDSPHITLIEQESINLDAGETTQITLAGEVLHTTTTGTYTTTIIAQGRDYQNNQLLQSDSFPFTLVINQDAADLVISEVTLEDESITCSTSTHLFVELTNNGASNEDDIEVTVRSSNLELSKETALSPNTQTTLDFKIPTENLTSGTNTLNIEARYRDNYESVNAIKTITKNNCLANYAPNTAQIVLADGQAQEFNVSLGEEGFERTITWFIDDQEQISGTETFTFSETRPGIYVLKAAVNANEEETQTWTITVTNTPLTTVLTTNLPEELTEQQLTQFADFMVENQFGKVVFSQPIDLTDILNLDEVILITNSLVAVDTEKAPQLDKPATITLKRTFENHLVLASEGFNSGEFTECLDSVCRVLSNQNNEFIFTVTGFSTYRVIDRQAVALQVSDILFDEINRGENASVSFKIRNEGTFGQITGLQYDLDLDARYSSQLSNAPETLSANQEQTITLAIDVPEDEDTGQHNVGTLTISSNELDDIRKDIVINPISCLTIEKVEINGKTSGDLSIEDDNEVELTIKNACNLDLEDVTITVESDNDNGDIDVESEEFNIDANEEESEKVDFSLDLEDLEDEEITLEITVEGDTEDGTRERVIEERTVDLDLEKHQLVIRRATLSSPSLQCLRQTSLQVTVENIGKQDEDDVEIRISNTALGLDQRETDIEVDKFSDSDNDHKETFIVDVQNAAAGTYPITIEVSRDGDQEATETVTLEVQDCLQTSQVIQTQQQLGTSDLAAQLQQQLQQQLQAQQRLQQPTEPIKTSIGFRDTDTYTIMLGVLVFLILVAVVLAFAVLVVRKK